MVLSLYPILHDSEMLSLHTDLSYLRQVDRRGVSLQEVIIQQGSRPLICSNREVLLQHAIQSLESTNPC